MARKPCLLVVEDDPSILRSIERLFTQKGYRVRLAQNGRQALEEIHENRPDLVVLDLNMPETDGLTVLMEIFDGKEAPAVLALTASGNRDKAESAVYLGAYEYVLKPFDVLDLEMKVDRKLEQIGNA